MGAYVLHLIGAVDNQPVNRASTLHLVAEDAVRERHHLRSVLRRSDDCIGYRLNDFANYYQYGCHKVGPYSRIHPESPPFYLCSHLKSVVNLTIDLCWHVLSL
jgi:hypothetical protein